jgi:hypothetical protein
MKILIGTPVYRAGAYALDKFLANQKQIQQRAPACELVLATCEPDFITELEKQVKQYELRATVIPYKVIKPDYAKSRIWSIACGREAARKYMLSNFEFDGLLFLDADMTFDISVVDIMTKEMESFDAVFSGYRHRDIGTGLAGAGCLIITRRILEKVDFKCYEFKNGNFINEDSTFEVNLFRQGARIKKGFFLSIDHYISSNEAKHIEPHKVGLWDKITTHPLFRYCLIKTGILVHYNLSNGLFNIANKLRKKR